MNNEELYTKISAAIEHVLTKGVKLRKIVFVNKIPPTNKKERPIVKEVCALGALLYSDWLEKAELAYHQGEVIPFFSGGSWGNAGALLDKDFAWAKSFSDGFDGWQTREHSNQEAYDLGVRVAEVYQEELLKK